VQTVPNDFFLTRRDEFQAWASSQKTLVMENFYRRQRVRLGILVTDGKPTGGAWNFDADNRLPPPKGHVYPQPLSFEPDEIDRQVLAEIAGSGEPPGPRHWRSSTTF
jgi:deoxyribodipyrimidine photolyase-related protein